ncbi:MAG: hypothetical protein FJ148_28440 [Deltaproteobacteria bacterium]|nr:hypothetical protein [Deltaproteobacteria bacterium]
MRGTPRPTRCARSRHRWHALPSPRRRRCRGSAPRRRRCRGSAPRRRRCRGSARRCCGSRGARPRPRASACRRWSRTTCSRAGR